MSAASMAQQQQQKKAAAAQQQAAANRELQQIYQKQAIEDRKRQEKLRKDQASARARFGASGLSAAGGSAAALVQGMEKEAAQESRDSWDMTQHAVEDINIRTRNLLDSAKTNPLDIARFAVGTAFKAKNVLDDYNAKAKLEQ
ncbi:hypothetical protein [Magnetospira sp. QH-2]|uniref:hypothetical protein n=1 Tax=Magnetospira sp. (strain QH-2) TaxID=1288970 RepID=UPI0011DCC82B|nr:hypothetical protein [Magnetospira sp. QH-2]